jgi:hypothetical protein
LHHGIGVVRLRDFETIAALQQPLNAEPSVTIRVAVRCQKPLADKQDAHACGSQRLTGGVGDDAA